MGLYLESTALEILSLLTTICILLYFFSWHRYGYWWRQDVYHLPASFPYGNFRDFILRRKTLEENFSDIYNKLKGCRYGGGVYFGLNPLLVIRDVELTRSFLSEDDNIATYQRCQPRGLHYSLANGKCYPQIHHEEKHIIVPQELKDAMVFKILQSSRALVSSIEDSSDTTVELNKLVSSYILKVKCSLGNESHIYCREENLSDKLFSNIDGNTFTSQVIKIVHSLVFPPQGRKRLSETEDHDKNAQERKLHPPIVKNKEQSTDGKKEDNEAMDHAMNVFIRSLENFSSTMASTIHDLSAQPKIQSKLQEEIDESLEKSGDVRYSDILKMNYLQNVVTEGLRKYPLFPIVLHRCTNGIKIPGTDVIVEKGTLVGIPVLEYHRDPRYYSDPEIFEPDRFSSAEIRKRIPNAFIPFGDGPESCYGLEFGLTVIKIGILVLVSKYNIELSETNDRENIKEKEIHLKFRQRT